MYIIPQLENDCLKWNDHLKVGDIFVDMSSLNTVDSDCVTFLYRKLYQKTHAYTAQHHSAPQNIPHLHEDDDFNARP